MNKILKLAFTSVMCFMMIAAIKINAQTVSAASKEELRTEIKNRTSENILKEYYDDYDGDGTKELFVVTGKKEGINQIWFANNDITECLFDEGDSVYSNSPGVCKVSGKQKIIAFEVGGYGSGSKSVCYYVSGNRAVRVQKSGEGLKHISGKKFVIHPSAFDMFSDGTGHTWKPYYVKWTGSKFEEYKVKQISESKLKKYKNASKYLKQAKKLGYKIGVIYKRSNGIINVNLHEYDKESGMVSNANITLKIKGKKVVLVSDNKKGKNIIEKSSHGGSYQAYGLLW